MSEQKKVYKTSSIVLGASLMHEGMKLAGLEPVPKRGDLFYFVFDDTDNRKDLVKAFSNNDLKVVPAVFMDIVRQLKQGAKEYITNRSDD